MNADGSARRRVAVSADYQVLVWSPDSTRLLFVGPRDSFEVVHTEGRPHPARIRGGDDPDWSG
jgi:Tol biopolymer transport system component